MRAMVLTESTRELELRDMPEPVPGPGQVLIEVEACAVCRTDLHIMDRELPPLLDALIPGHQIVGRVLAADEGPWARGTRVGVPWLGYTCGRCEYCSSGRENLCDRAEFMGYSRQGGFAQRVVADARYCFPLDPTIPAAELAPLLCAGLIGFRAWRMCGDARRIGIYGFGAAAHVLAQVLRHERRELYAFARAGDRQAMQAALDLGATWAGTSTEPPPASLDAAIIFAPLGALVPIALAHVRKGSRVVCAGIHMSPIPEFPYELLWGERELTSVANLTRQDGVEFLELAARIPIGTRVTRFPLERANDALEALRDGRITGSAVLQIAPPLP